jgi:alpha-tubulin suppressor-like RCC1 family protein
MFPILLSSKAVVPYVAPTSGLMYSTGDATTGQWNAGNGTTNTDYSSPVVVGSNNWKQVATGSRGSMALRSDGTLWAWGINTSGECGQGATSPNYCSPVQIGALTTWTNIGGRSAGFLAISAGRLFTWGYGGSGAIGNGAVTAQNSPVQVGSLTTWSTVNSLAYTYAGASMKTSGEIFAWGENSDGGLGISSTSDVCSPNQVGTKSDYAQFDFGDRHGCGVDDSGRLFCWGVNSSGELGFGDTTTISSPSQVGSLTDWARVYCGASSTLAIKTDGTMFAWGNNSAGRLGLGDATARSSPVQVGVASNWARASISRGGHAHAVTTNGKLFTWGTGAGGRKGDGGTTNTCVPNQIGSDQGWLSTIDKGTCGGAKFSHMIRGTPG